MKDITFLLVTMTPAEYRRSITDNDYFSHLSELICLLLISATDGFDQMQSIPVDIERVASAIGSRVFGTEEKILERLKLGPPSTEDTSIEATLSQEGLDPIVSKMKISKKDLVESGRELLYHQTEIRLGKLVLTIQGWEYGAIMIELCHTGNPSDKDIQNRVFSILESNYPGFLDAAGSWKRVEFPLGNSGNTLHFRSIEAHGSGRRRKKKK